MKTKTAGGFTLIELLMAIIVGAIVILGVGLALVAGHGYLNKAWDKVNLQRAGDLAMLHLTHAIKEGDSATIENDGKTLRIHKEEGWIAFSYINDQDLIFQLDDTAGQTIITDDVEDLLFTLEGNKVGIDLKLREENIETHFISTVMIRNYGK